MLSPKQIYKQINTLTADLIGLGLCEKQAFPSMNEHGNRILIGTTNMEYAIFLKSMPYSVMYNEAFEKGYYNMQMIDGALISLSYEFEKNKIIKHRLSFFPAPYLKAFKNNPDLYLSDEIYADIIDIINKGIFPIPLRFDYDSRAKVAVPIEHPISHLTLGQYDFCRIPVSSALTPHQFLHFIIRNFYSTESKRNYEKLSAFTGNFSRSIFGEEEHEIHLVII